MSKYLAIYLQDHFAGATAGLDLARRTASSNEDEPSGPVLSEIAEEIASDRETLANVMASLGVGADRPKVVLAWAMEKVGRLKPNGELLKYSPLSRLVELEGLSLGVEGKLSLWRSLEHQLAGDPRVKEFDFAALIERAQSQRERLETLRVAAAALAFAGESD